MCRAADAAGVQSGAPALRRGPALYGQETDDRPASGTGPRAAEGPRRWRSMCGMPHGDPRMARTLHQATKRSQQPHPAVTGCRQGLSRWRMRAAVKRQRRRAPSPWFEQPPSDATHQEWDQLDGQGVPAASG
jgi:hypothetical protein